MALQSPEMFCHLASRTVFSKLPTTPIGHLWALLTQAKHLLKFTKTFLTSFLLPWSLLKSEPTSRSTSDGVCNSSRRLGHVLRLALDTLATMEFMNWCRTLTQTHGASVPFRRDGAIIQSRTARPIHDSAL